MPALDSKLRSQLDDVCQKARDLAEAAARSALQKRAVDAAEPHTHFTADEKELRNRLRARGRQAGDVRQANKTQEIEQLTQEFAYEYWHRMLFARFLAENHLLMHPDDVAVSLEECEELAKSEDASNGFVLAARYASKMLPQIFRTGDVLLEVEFAPEHRLVLEKLLASLPRETFLADDSLGWVYQFWQSKKKDEVNKSGNKIDGRTLPAVTQLFTEDYMVQFLLHNTIGAWWCAQHGIEGPPGGAGIPTGRSPVEMEYLRWRDDGTPAAGKFEGWPKTLAEFTMLDPCCGSGHFLVAAFNLLVPLRMHDEGLTAEEASEAVLRDNLFGLELDPRCTQIAAFALAVAAWKFPGDHGQPLGYRELPPLNIACTGIGPQATEDEWLRLAEQSGKPMTVLSRESILNGLRKLYALFSDAPTIGSLIDPNQLSADLITADYETLQPYLAAALTAEQADEDTHERAVAAAGMVKAAALLAGEYALVMTNVPFQGSRKLDGIVNKYMMAHYSSGKANLATAFVLRCLDLCETQGCIALVTPQSWLFQSDYTKLRDLTLRERTWNMIARLGPRAFETITGEVVNVALLTITAAKPSSSATIAGVDVSDAKTPDEKNSRLTKDTLITVRQSEQVKNPDSALKLATSSLHCQLSESVITPQGVKTGDDDKWMRCFWEITTTEKGWENCQSTVDVSIDYGGCSRMIDWRTEGEGMVRPRKGNLAKGRLGVAVSQIGSLPVSIYLGHHFDSNVAPVVPSDAEDLPALYAYLGSPSYSDAVRAIDQSLKVTNATLAKVPFDYSHWQNVASEKYPNGLPEPHSDDPTQWLFKGEIATSTDPLQVSVARLLGYHWPDQPKTADAIDKLADSDGILCLPGVRGEAAAAERLLEVLHTAYDKDWSDPVLHKLLTDTGCKSGTTLDDWLRNAFFEQHCKKFHNRPFLWHIWDGRKDGFSAVVNYHKLDHKALENLTYSYLGDWIKAQTGDAKSGKPGADLRLAAAQELQAKLKLILAGEPPYDIFVRWKPLHEQAIGWNPDLNDGVRMNIRPFIEAGVLRKNPNIKWTKDRGKEPQRDQQDYPWFWDGSTFTGDRVNDIHLTNAEKQAARDRKGG